MSASMLESILANLISWVLIGSLTFTLIVASPLLARAYLLFWGWRYMVPPIVKTGNGRI